MKKAFCICMAVGLCLLLMGCSSREPLAADGFRAAAEGLGMEVREEDPVAAGFAGVTQVLAAESEGASARMVLFDNDVDARSMYARAVAGIDRQGEIISALDSANYNKLIAPVGEGVYAVLRINNTLFYGNDKGGGEMEALLKAMGYG